MSGRGRTRVGAELAKKLAAGTVEVQYCKQCDTAQYPPASVCRRCLCDELEWRASDDQGEVISSAVVLRSYAKDFDADNNWPIASVEMRAGPVVFAHVFRRLEPGTRVTLIGLTDRLGDGVFGAFHDPADRAPLMAKFAEQP